MRNLFVAWGVFALWLPFRLFATCKSWYYDLTLLVDYAAFGVTVLFAVFTLVMLFVAFAIINKRLSLEGAVVSVMGGVGSVVGIIAAFKPEWLPRIFHLIDRWPAPIVALMVLMFVVLLACLAFAAVSPSRADRERRGAFE